MALRKPSDFFVREVVEETKVSVLNTDDSLREELNRVENLSEEISKLQQDIYQKTVENNSVVFFKEQVSQLSNIVNNLVENEIPKYKKQVAGNEIRLSNQVSNFKEDIDRKVDSFYKKISEFTDVIHVLETVSKIEKYVQENHKEFVSLREEIFEELNNIPLGNIQNNIKILEEKIDLIAENYSEIQEGLLNEPPDVKNSDPLTPLDQKFVTVEDLNKHYSLFINRIQEQLATVGGGGETQLKYLDDIVGIATNPSAYNGKFLKYDHTIGKFVFASAGGAGSQTLDDTLQLGNTSSLGMSVGVITALSFSGNATSATYATTSGVSTYSTTAGIATVAQGLTGTPNINVGVVTATSFSGNGTNLTGIVTSIVAGNNITISGSTGQVTINSTATGGGNSGYANTAGIATYATTSGIATYASTAGISTYSDIAGVSTYATSSGVSTNSGYASTAGISTYADIAGVSTIAGYATTAGISTLSQGLTGTPNINVGVVTATSFVGDGSGLTNLPGGGGGGIAGINTTGTSFFNQLQVSGIATFQSDVQLGSNDKIILGDSNNFQVYHTGSDAWILNGIGNLHLRTDFQNSIIFQDGTSDTLAQFNSDGSVELYYNNSKKFETTGSGINVTGIVTATSYNGSGTNLTGIVTSIVAGTNITVSGSTGQVTINSTASSSSIDLLEVMLFS